MAFDYVGHVSCAAVAYFKVVSFEDLVQFVIFGNVYQSSEGRTLQHLFAHSG